MPAAAFAFDLCVMKVYKVMFKDNTATSAKPVKNLHHGDIGLKEDKETVQWFALESPDKKTALEVAERVIKMIWGKEAA